MSEAMSETAYDTAVIWIGTRSSPMALAQVARVRAELAAVRPDLVTEVVPFTTSGDRWAGPLSALGGKGAHQRDWPGAAGRAL